MVVLDVLTSLFAIVILCRAVSVSNHMNLRTCHVMRLAVLILGVSALGMSLAPLPFYRHESWWIQPFFVFSVALYMLVDRRISKGCSRANISSTS